MWLHGVKQFALLLFPFEDFYYFNLISLGIPLLCHQCNDGDYFKLLSLILIELMSTPSPVVLSETLLEEIAVKLLKLVQKNLV